MTSLHKKISLWCGTALVGAFLMVGVALFTADTSYAQTSPDPAEEGETCAVEKVGWILCPLLESAGRASDQAYGYLAGNFLEIDSELFNSDDKNPTKLTWEQARNLANVAFILAFILLIYSQITGGVMSNYGIKRMLPRLIIAAVAVNVSYYICQGMIDLSNILGYNVKAALDKMVLDLQLPTILGQSNQGINTQTSSGNGVGSRVEDLVAITLAAGAVVWGLIALMTGSIAIVLTAVLFFIIVLLLRKALVVLLVVASPLAFVAYLLPNTEKYFKKWLSMFWQLLMLFPIIAALMGAGQLASGIILAANVAQKSSGTSYNTQPNNQVAVDTAYNKISDGGILSNGIVLSNDITNSPDTPQPGQVGAVKLAQATATCDGTKTSAGDFCGDLEFDTGRGPADPGAAFAALIMATALPAAGAIRVNKSIANLGGSLADLSGKLQTGSSLAGKAGGAMTKGVGKGAVSLAKQSDYVAAGMLAWQRRGDNSKRAFTERGVRGLTSGRAGRAIARGANVSLAHPGGGGVNSGRTIAAAAEAGHHFVEQGIKERSALEMHNMEHRNAGLPPGTGVSEHAWLAQQYETAIRNNDQEGMISYQNMLTDRGRDGLRAMRGALQNTHGAQGSHEFNEAMQHYTRNRTDALQRGAADVYTLAYHRGNGNTAMTMQDVRNDADTYASLDDTTMATQDFGQTVDDTGAAIAGGGLSLGAMTAMGREATMVDPTTGERIVTNLAGKIRATDSLRQQVRADTMAYVDGIANLPNRVSGTRAEK